jgi:hypothetical protein
MHVYACSPSACVCIHTHPPAVHDQSDSELWDTGNKYNALLQLGGAT